MSDLTPPPFVPCGTSTGEGVQVRTPDATASDLAIMPNDELLELYQQISSRVGMYNTEVLIQRMFEIRKELNRRMADLTAAQAALAEAKADNESLRTLWTEIRTVLIQSRAANCVCSYGAQQADAVEAANAVLKRMPPDVTTERDQLRARVAELEADKARLDWLLDNAELSNPQNCSEGWDTRAAIDAARAGKGTP